MSINLKYPSLLSYTKKYNLYLGSGSYSRKLILQENDVPFNVLIANINEKPIGNRLVDKPHDLVTLIALEKAKAIISDNKHISFKHNDILLTADQVVVFDNKILEKPIDLHEARLFINRYINNSCSTVGSIVLTNMQTGQQVYDIDQSTIHFGDIPNDIIDKIISEGNVLNCAGGLMIEHPLLQPYINKIEGTQDSLMGLSCQLLQSLFDKLDNIIENAIPFIPMIS